jgi:hypothetical protein
LPRHVKFFGGLARLRTRHDRPGGRAAKHPGNARRRMVPPDAVCGPGAD